VRSRRARSRPARPRWVEEIFRRFEFRNLLNRVDELDAAVPAAAPLKVTGIEVPWREGALDFRGVVGYSAIADRAAVGVGTKSSSVSDR